MEHPSSGAATQRPESIGRVAADLLDALRVASPDVGDDHTQVVLDDVLDSLEVRLRRLAEEGS